MGYLSQVRSGGKQYIYLTEYCGNQDFSTKRERHIYKFGNSLMALRLMKRWYKRFDIEFPIQLIERGYTKQDLENWINTIETGITKNGRPFNVETRRKRAIY